VRSACACPEAKDCRASQARDKWFVGSRRFPARGDRVRALSAHEIDHNGSLAGSLGRRVDIRLAGSLFGQPRLVMVSQFCWLPRLSRRQRQE
jgi:hypothetical protein